MALQQDFTDSCGVAHVAAHWRMAGLHLDGIGRAIGLTFYGYASFAAFVAGKAPLAGAVKSYAAVGAEFASVVAQAPVGANLYDVVAHAVEAYAIGKLDTPTGSLDGQGNPVLASFFAAATQV